MTMDDGFRKSLTPGQIATVVLLALMVFIVVTYNSRPAKVPTTSRTITMSQTEKAVSQTEKPTTIATSWTYDTELDAMGRERSTALVASTNTLSFGFPYQGEQYGLLTIRKTARFGTEVIFGIEKGQILCGYSDCEVNVRFDDGLVQTFPASGTADHKTTLLFIHNQKRFIVQLQKAKVVRIEATFYHEGSQALEFNVNGYVPL